MRKHLQHYIDGRWTDSIGGERHFVVDPATERTCTEIVLGTAADVDAAVAAARAALPEWSRSPVEERIALLDRIVEEYGRRAEDLARAVSEEMGAPIGFSTMAQVPTGLAQFQATAAALAGFRFEEAVGASRVLHEPIGVVAMITPWNWPLNQICAKVAPALAAGNAMVLKPSEEAPSCAIILAEILHDAGVPHGVFNLVNGDGARVGAALAGHADVDMISFTGSTRAGVAVAQAAAPTVKRVHQELGGKAANLVLEGADLASVLPSTVSGVLANSGQSCIAPTRLLVHRSQIEDATSIVRSMMEQTSVGDPAEMGHHIGPVVNEAQYDRIQELIRSALDEGATLVVGGTGRPDGLDAGFYVRPTLFRDVSPDMRIAREETFGPVATITGYDDLEEAIAIAHDTEYGLSTAISGDPSLAVDVARRLRVGLVTINGWTPDVGAPFGGYKRSGNGREHGRYGLADFMEIKTIVGIDAGVA